MCGCNDPHGHFRVLPSVCRLERSYSDPKSFMTCWDWQFGHLVVRLVLVRVFVFWSLWTLNDHFRSKVQEDDIGIQFWRFHQLRKGHFRLVAWSTWLSRFSVWVGAIRRFILWSLTLVNIMSKRARMRIPSAWLAPKCRVWSRLALLLCLEVFDIFPSPFVGFYLK